MKTRGEPMLLGYTAYLIENIAMIILLFLAVAITLTVLFKVYIYKMEIRDQLEANLLAQNLIEYAKAEESDYMQVLKDLKAKKIETNYYLYYDANWNLLADTKQPQYIAEIIISNDLLADGRLKNIQVIVYKDGMKNIIYSLSGKVC